MAEGDTQDPEPVINEVHEYLPRRRLLLLGYLLLALAVAALVVFGARAVYRHSHKPTVKTVPTINTKQLPSAPPASLSGTNANSNQPASSGNLPNSGPGQVVGLFIGVSLAATALHFALSLRRYSRPD